MTEFERLLHTGLPGQRAMLAAAKDDAPSASSQKRVLLALGLGGAIASTVTSSTAGASASLSAPAAIGITGTVSSPVVPSLAAPIATSLAAPAASLTAAVVMKWCAVATLALSMGVAGGLLARRVAWSPPVGADAADSRQGGPATASGAPDFGVAANQDNTLPAAKLDTARAEATLPLPPPHKDLGPSEAIERAASNPASHRLSAGRAVAAPGLTVRAEIALVEKARDALRRGDPSGCLSFLEIRRKDVRGGVLAPEATILRIEALRSLGQRARATEEAERFLHDYPDSPLLERIRDLLEASEP